MSQKDARKQPSCIPGSNEKPRDNTPHTRLKRRLTHRQIAMIGLSGALGTGLFLGSDSVISFVGPATIVSYYLAGMVVPAVMRALTEIVSVYPIPGGHEAVATSFSGKSGRYLACWNLAIGMLVAIGAEITASATYLQRWSPSLYIGVGIVLCFLFTAGLNLATVKLYGSTEYWFSMIKVAAVVVFILLDMSLIFAGSPTHPEPVGLSHLTAYGGFAPLSLTGTLLVVCIAVFSSGGIENVPIVVVGSENPSHSIPRATKTMIWCLLFFYVLGVGVILALQDW